MSQHWKYLKYVLRHKWFVFVECLRLGVPIWTAILHDWDKFLPSEWIPYSRFFYGGDYFPSRESHEGFGRPSMLGIFIYTREDVERDFAAAWNQHQKINKHHWQYWMLTWDRGETECLPMPDVYLLEMIADWRGAGRALGKPDTLAWYLKNKDNIKLHPATRGHLEYELGVPSELRTPMPELAQ